jgi:citrate synthase
MKNYIKMYTELTIKNNTIDPNFFDIYNVKRGLRNENGTGVLVGLSQVSNVVGYKMVNKEKTDSPGTLLYRGYNVEDLVKGLQKEDRFGFEETIFLLIFGELPTKNELIEFQSLLGKYRNLPDNFVEDMILKIPSINVMNKLMRTILVLYSFDPDPENQDIANILQESIRLIARFPTIVSYGYQSKAHYFDNQSLVIHQPRADLATAEYILYLIRADGKFTKKEAETLDLCMLLHADHGANNSSFATHVVASTGTDIYSTIATAVGSLKGPKHGGATIFVSDMIEDIKSNCDYGNINSLELYLRKIINKEAFDKKGLIYGIGHAVYTLSDPRALILKTKAKELAIEKDMLDEYQLYMNIEECSNKLFIELKGISMCANVDLYSGFVYSMLNIPTDLYTPIFAVSRVGGWVAHRIEQLLSDKKILRPAYEFVYANRTYESMKERTTKI